MDVYSFFYQTTQPCVAVVNESTMEACLPLTRCMSKTGLAQGGIFSPLLFLLVCWLLNNDLRIYIERAFAVLARGCRNFRTCLRLPGISLGGCITLFLVSELH